MRQSRTRQQVLSDMDIIMSNSDKATSFNNLAKLSQLTHSQLMTTLSKFPDAKRSIATKLQNNFMQQNYQLGYVIDASIAEESLWIIDQILEKKQVVILLNQTISELDHLHKHSTNIRIAQSAQRIIDMALYNKESFVIANFQMPRNLSVDDTIIEYCKQNRHRVILITADKNMALKAEGAKVVVQNYYRGLPPSTRRLENGEVELHTFCKKTQKIRLFSADGNVHEREPTPNRLKKGDQIYVATKMSNSIKFEHFEMLDDKGGCNLVYKTEGKFERNKMMMLPNRYKSFIEEAKRTL